MGKRQTSRRKWILDGGLGIAAAALSPKLASFATIDGRTLAPMQAEAQAAPTGDEKGRVRRMKWWREARFGMFIHWGLYSILGRHEWVMANEGIPVSEYWRSNSSRSRFRLAIGPSSRGKPACATWS